MWYTVRDNINGVILDFSKKEDAEKEVARRLKKYRAGYDIRRNHFDACNAGVIENNNTYIITVLNEVR